MQTLQKTPSTPAQREDGITMRRPTSEDGAAMWQLVKDTGVLDLNSAYLYLMMGRYMGGTCIVAEQKIKGKTQMLGFVMGFIPPHKRDTYFLWQVGVSSAARGKGLATRMIRQLLKMPACQHIRRIETTITPSNTASRKLFQGVARRLNAPLKVQSGFDKSIFPPGAAHESEDLFLIGPFAAQGQQAAAKEVQKRKGMVTV